MDIERAARRTREMDLTPLIDIVFQLVIFFMLTTTFVVSESMELSLPGGKATAAASDALRIQIAPGGRLEVNGQATDEDRLNSLLVSRLAADIDTKIAIFTTPGVNVQQLVTVMDLVYLTGGRNVQVQKVE